MFFHLPNKDVQVLDGIKEAKMLNTAKKYQKLKSFYYLMRVNNPSAKLNKRNTSLFHSQYLLEMSLNA